jgi:hypothetical protein
MSFMMVYILSLPEPSFPVPAPFLASSEYSNVKLKNIGKHLPDVQYHNPEDNSVLTSKQEIVYKTHPTSARFFDHF